MELWDYDTKAEMLGLNLTDVFPERTLGRHYAEMKEAVDTDSLRPFETVALTKYGNEIPVLISGTALKDAKGELLGFVGAFRDITERKRLEQSLANIAEAERERLRRDLHDSVGQQLTGLRLLVTSLSRELSPTHPGVAARAAQIDQIAGDVMTSVRQIAKGLEPLSAGPDALVTALHELASHINSLYDVQCRFTSRQPVLVQNPDAGTHLLLIAQEAAANAVKHAQAGRITISLSERNSTLRLVVRDDGVGLSGRKQHKGMGMGIMRSRATLIGASFDVQAGKAGGTVVTCSWKKTPPEG